MRLASRASILGAALSTAHAFRAISLSSSLRFPTKLRDIHEWRDHDDTSSSREICLLPFPLEEALLQGETKQLRLYEDRFIDLFDECMEKNHGILGMGLIASANGILMHLPLCEIEGYNRSMEEMGIFVTIRAISRVELESISQESPYIKATCKEVFDDDTKPNLSRANMIASDIENAMIQLSSLDSQLKAYDDEYETILAEDRSFGVDSFSEDDDEDSDEEDEPSEDRRTRFRQVYQTALNSDTHGYTSTGAAKVDEDMRSLRELTAISWAAAICTNPTSNPILRLQAVESMNIEERLELALRALKIERNTLKKRLKDAKQAVVDDDEEGEFM